MAKTKLNYNCSGCGTGFAKWAGQCTACDEWNTIEEGAPADAQVAGRFSNWSGAAAEVIDLRETKMEVHERQSTGIGELNRVLGGGLVSGSVVLIGGDPGVGKSTLLMQVMGSISATAKVLYVSGEESPGQLSIRKVRLGLGESEIKAYPETELEKILAVMQKMRPAVMVVDSIQTIFSNALTSTPGNVAQVKECAAQLTKAAKSMGITVFLIGHVTKEGALAGPRVLEHIVDVVLYFEGEQGMPFRIVRAIKNRYGAVNELGIFAMTELGLAEVSNPSSLFLTAHERPVSGSSIFSALEGNRPFLVEVQALVEDSVTANPKRYATGVDTNRLQMLLAILNKHAGIAAHEQNVYVKIVGGVKLSEPAADLPLLLAAYSSLDNKPLPAGLISFGEVGLAGEIRQVPDPLTRLKEAAKVGFTTAIVPAACRHKSLEEISGMSVTYASRVGQAIDVLRSLRQK